MSSATKIMIIRHAEKPTTNPPTTGITLSGSPDSDSLIPQGWQRAGALVALFDPDGQLQLQGTALSTPQFLYATDSSGSEGNRPQETIEPLEKKLGLTTTLISKTKSDPTQGLKDLVSAAMACNGVVLISWPHGEIPLLVSLLPLVKPIPATWSWPKERFDMVFVFDLNGSTYTLSQIPQLLLDGDSSENISTGS